MRPLAATPQTDRGLGDHGTPEPGRTVGPRPRPSPGPASAAGRHDTTGDTPMESRRFDDLARTLAASRSRRQALRALAGGVAAGLLATRRPEAVSALPVCYPRCNSAECETCDPELGACVYRC